MPIHAATPSRSAAKTHASRARAFRALASLFAAAWLAACSSTGPSAANSPLIPRYMLFGGGGGGADLSPDGRWRAYLKGNMQGVSLWLEPVGHTGPARVLLTETQRSLYSVQFTASGSHLLYVMSDQEGDENYQYFALDVATGKSVALSHRGVKTAVANMSARIPGEVLLEMNDRDHRQFDLVRVDLATGRGQRVLENPGFSNVITDAQYRLRYAEEQTDEGGSRWYVHDGRAWKPWIDIPQADALTSRMLHLTPDGGTLHVLDSRGRNTAALYAVDTATGQRRLLHADDQADVDELMRHPRTGAVQAVSVQHLRRRWVALDPELAPDLERLQKFAPGGAVSGRGRTNNHRTWVVGIHRADASDKYYHYDRDSGEFKLWYDTQPLLVHYHLVPMHTAEIAARDGLVLPSYLSLPPGSDADGNGRPERPQPMVLGGPWTRDEYGLDRNHQWLANRGYAVLSVNYRGSTGFGKAHTNAGDGEWGRKMHEDLLDAVQWAVRSGIALPDKVAIMGGSYGGYAALAGLALTPKAFACGVSVVGPSNLISFIEAAPSYWDPHLRTYSSRVGDVDTVPGRRMLTERSPLTHVQKIERPLLVAHGGRDPRVRQAESDQMVAAVQKNGTPVVYVLYPDEGHGFGNARNRLSFNAVTEQFLRGCLGGEAEKIERDFWGSSIVIPAGASLMPAVKAAYTSMPSSR
jgi:dipeptidyl aminopeptidase/acylaminoacyl peptidase